VESINGADAAGQSFVKIMDIPGEVMDQRMSQHFYVSRRKKNHAKVSPITVVYQEGAGADVQWLEMKDDIWEGFSRRGTV